MLVRVRPALQQESLGLVPQFNEKFFIGKVCKNPSCA